MSDFEAMCPECRVGKHQNCNGDAWNFVVDEFVLCFCAERDHK